VSTKNRRIWIRKPTRAPIDIAQVVIRTLWFLVALAALIFVGVFVALPG
jgi:hypothetical protein